MGTSRTPDAFVTVTWGFCIQKFTPSTNHSVWAFSIPMSALGGRAYQAAGNALSESKYVLLRGLPPMTTSHDLRRLLIRNEIKGVSEVSLFYKHCRPTGKAILTMALPDYTRNAIREASSLSFPGRKIDAEPITNIKSYGIGTGGQRSTVLGTGPSANCPERRTVTIHGFPGRTPVSQVVKLLEGFRVDKDLPVPAEMVPLPERKFALVSRFLVYLESESEAQRFVRKYHMTRHKITNGLLKATIIY
ncbi:hypothetical protein JR316_0003459 [Psilocybe cubensis]|uniref:Uncharacterized protein n=2 Tax=Psilocybe cubensis TaxID=181762 RepID=A0ACB8H7U1_PSICU|nr:hypothetical protein JR316_0003459 [Psilocybe cubensis]KAH9483981.1 hypothetical protein JR316_0003459 [Psilocybe cubensis]